jgi:hypothetical protein
LGCSNLGPSSNRPGFCQRRTFLIAYDLEVIQRVESFVRAINEVKQGQIIISDLNPCFEGPRKSVSSPLPPSPAFQNTCLVPETVAHNITINKYHMLRTQCGA